MIAAVGSRLVILLFGTLYPAYASYKAVRTKDVKAYVQWMMYWIVFALFTCVETVSDVFLSFWVPFYYEMKVVIVLWLLSPATKGSSLLYRKFVHPTLTEREREIDEYLTKMRERSYSTMLELGSKGINYALQTAIKGGGGLVNQLRKSYSLSDLTDHTDAVEQQQQQQPQGRRRKVQPPPQLHPEEEISDDDMDELPLGGAHRGYSPRRSASGSGRVEMYFPAVDVEVRQRGGTPAGDSARTSGRSTTTLSNELTDGVDSGLEVENEPLMRTASLSSTRTSTRTRRAPAHAPGVVTTPGGRTKSITAVTEEVTAVDPLVADESSDSDSFLSPTTSEQITVLEKENILPSINDKPSAMPPIISEQLQIDQSIQEPSSVVEGKIEVIMKTDVMSVPKQVNVEEIKMELEELKNKIPMQNLEPLDTVVENALICTKVEDKSTEATFEFKNQADDVKDKAVSTQVHEVATDLTPTKIEEDKTSQLEHEKSKEPIELSITETSEESAKTELVVNTPVELNIASTSDITEKIEHLQDAIVKQIEPKIIESESNQEVKPTSNENMNNVRVTVDISMPKSDQESMHVRLSMESLPTSPEAAEVVDAMIPVFVENYDSESNIDSSNIDTDSLASVSLPSTPSVSRSSSRLSDGRAGKYNKRPAPPRPESPATEDKPVKGRLVLQPGVVRNLPEAMGASSEVFLRTPNQKRKKQHKNSGGIAGMFPFWKQDTRKDESDDEVKVPIAKMTNL